MGNELNGITCFAPGVCSNTTSATAERSWEGLKVSGLKPGDKVRISSNGIGKYLFVNDSAVLKLDSLWREPRIILCGENLTRENITVKNEPGMAALVELQNKKGEVLDSFAVESHQEPTDQNLVEQFKDSPLKGYPVAGKGFVGIKIKGSW